MLAQGDEHLRRERVSSRAAADHGAQAVGANGKPVIAKETKNPCGGPSRRRTVTSRFLVGREHPRDGFREPRPVRFTGTRAPGVPAASGGS